MTAPVDRLRRLVAALEAGEMPNPDDTAWLVTGAREYLRDAPAERLDTALGLHPDWGRQGWWTTGPRAARDAVLADMDRQLFGHLDITTSAKSIVALARRRQERADVPDQQARLLDRLISTGKGLPGPKQIANILRNSRDPSAQRIGAQCRLLARKWEIAENLHRADLTSLQRSEHIAEWVRLTEEKAKVAQVAPPGGKQPRDQGINAAVRELGVDRTEAQRAVKIAALPSEAKEAAISSGLDKNQSALLEAARAVGSGNQMPYRIS